MTVLGVRGQEFWVDEGVPGCGGGGSGSKAGKRKCSVCRRKTQKQEPTAGRTATAKPAELAGGEGPALRV